MQLDIEHRTTRCPIAGGRHGIRCCDCGWAVTRDTDLQASIAAMWHPQAAATQEDWQVALGPWEADYGRYEEIAAAIAEGVVA